MLEKEKLRKADIITGLIFFLFGAFILSQALQMPMKDSWGGVQNVWFVSPALFPLFIGSMITFLGGLLALKGLREVGMVGIKEMMNDYFGPKAIVFLTSPISIRFYAITLLFIFYVYMYVPRVDFILCSLLFLVVFISMFYFDDDALLLKLFIINLAMSVVMLVYFMTLHERIIASITHFADFLTIILTFLYTFIIWSLTKGDAALAKKFKTTMIVSLITPLVLGGIFKYFLLVPLIHEGVVIQLFDAIRYM